jgi:hypothetical protein
MIDLYQSAEDFKKLRFDFADTREFFVGYHTQ